MKLMEIVQSKTTLYRAARKQYLSDINQNGFVPRTGTDRWEGKKYSKPSVFLFGDLKCSLWHTIRILANTRLQPGETHETWTNEDWSNYFNSISIFEVDVSNLPVEYVGKVDEVEEYICTETITPDRIKNLNMDVESKFKELMRVC